METNSLPSIKLNVEGNLDLRNTFGRRWNANKVEIAMQFVVPEEFSFALINLDLGNSLTGQSR